jgi:hypothetical protein
LEEPKVKEETICPSYRTLIGELGEQPWPHIKLSFTSQWCIEYLIRRIILVDNCPEHPTYRRVSPKELAQPKTQPIS